MKLVNLFAKFFVVIIAWGILFFPVFACSASSGLASVWAEDRHTSIKTYMPIHVEGLANPGVIFVNFSLILIGAFALMIIMIGGLKMFLADGNEDSYHSAKHSFVAGIVSFVLALVLYLSLDQVFGIVEELASRMA